MTPADQLGLFGSRSRTLTRAPDAAQARTEALDGMARAEEHAAAGWKAAALDAIRQLAARPSAFTADDVRAIVGDPPAGTHFNAIGALFSAAAKSGIIHMSGYAKSSRVIGHGNLVRAWEGMR